MAKLFVIGLLGFLGLMFAGPIGCIIGIIIGVII